MTFQFSDLNIEDPLVAEAFRSLNLELTSLNSRIVQAGGAEVNDLSSVVTWANIPDAFVPVSAVTQHVASINHDLLLNFVPAEHVDWALTGPEDIHVDRISVVQVGAVTAHEAALTILESQITDGSILARLASTETITANWTFDGDEVTFPDDKDLVFGSGADIRLDYNSTADEFRFVSIAATNWAVIQNATQTQIRAIASGAVSLSFSGAQKIITLATGISVTGDVGATTFNAVPLTDAGAATNYLDESGAYSVPTGSSPVDSVFGRTGVVVALTGDYAAFYPEIIDAETITGVWTFTQAVKIRGTAIGALRLENTISAVDEEIWFLRSAGGPFQIQTATDAGAIVATAMQINRTGTAVDDVTFNAPILATSYDGVNLTTAGAATNFLNETGAYSVPPGGGGNVGNTGTPLNNQLAIWTDATTIEGSPELTWDGTGLTIDEAGVGANAGLKLTGGVTGGVGIMMLQVGGAADENRWNFDAAGGAFTMRPVSDAISNGAAFFFANRVGNTIDDLQLITTVQIGLDTLTVICSGDITATNFNAVPLTAAGASTNFLNEAGAYSVPPSSVPTAITVADEAADTTSFPLFGTAPTGDLGPKTNAGLTFNAAIGNLSATQIAGIVAADLLDKAANETITGFWNFTVGDINIADNVQLQVGGGADGAFHYHSGSDEVRITGIGTADFRLILNATETAIFAQINAGVSLFYNNAQKLITVVGGITVTGDVGATTFNAVPLTAAGSVSNFLNETGAYSVPGGGGNVSNTGTPVDNQIAIWTDATTIEGVAGLTFDGTSLVATQFAGIVAANLLDKTALEDISNDWEWQDNQEIRFGTGNDARIFFDTNDLRLQLTGVSNQFIIQLNGTELSAVFNPNGSVDSYYDNILRLHTAASGVVVIKSDTNTETEGRLLEFQYQNALVRGFIGYDSTSVLAMRNQAHGGNLELSGEDVGGVPRTFLLGDPDAITTLRGDTDIRLETGAGTDLALIARLNSSVGLFFNNVEKLTTTTVGVNVTGIVDADDFQASAFGTAANPTFSMLTDIDTGMYGESSNVLSFSSAAVRRLQLYSAVANFSVPLRTTGAPFGKTAGFADLGSDFLNMDGKEVIDANDTFLRLNQNADFSSGVYTPGAFRADGNITANGNIVGDGATVISGIETLTIDATGDITKASHGNYLYHHSTIYNDDQEGGITFDTGNPTGGADGDIWFKYTA